MRAGASPYVDWRDKRTYGNFTIHELSYSEDGLPQYGKSYDVPRNSVVEGSVVINDSTSEPGQFTVGSAISGTLSFEIYNFCGQYDSINWKGAWISAYIDVLGLDPNRPSTNESGEESICLKRYHVKSHTTTGNIIKITAVDILTLMDQHTLAEIGMTTTDAKLFIELLVTRSMTLPGLITNVKLVYFDDLPNVSLKQPDNLNMTIRDALAYAAQCLGCYVRATYWEGIRTDNIINGASLKGDALEFGWYDKTPEIPADAAFSQTMDTDPVTITGVTVTYADDGGNEAQKVLGSDSGYMLRIPENPFVCDDNIDEVAQNIYNLVNGMSFYPGNFTIKSDPLIEAGDTILVTTPRHENIPVIVSDLSYKPGLVTANVSADIDTGDDLYTNQVDFVRKVIKDETGKSGGESSSGGGGGGANMVGIFDKSVYYSSNVEWLASNYYNVNGVLIEQDVDTEISGNILTYKLYKVSLTVTMNVSTSFSGTSNKYAVLNLSDYLPYGSSIHTEYMYTLGALHSTTRRNQEEDMSVRIKLRTMRSSTGGISYYIYLDDEITKSSDGSMYGYNSRWLHIPIETWIYKLL